MNTPPTGSVLANISLNEGDKKAIATSKIQIANNRKRRQPLSRVDDNEKRPKIAPQKSVSSPGILSVAESLLNLASAVEESSSNSRQQQEVATPKPQTISTESCQAVSSSQNLVTTNRCQYLSFAEHFDSLKKLMATHYPNGGYVIQRECKCDDTLWYWIRNIRATRRLLEQGKEPGRRLTYEHIAQLDSIGFLWEDPTKSEDTPRLSTRTYSPGAAFARHFESLKELMKTHYPNGGYVIQRECKCDDTLRNWFLNIRKFRRQMEQGKEPERRLTDEEISQLDSIGFLWEKPPISQDRPLPFKLQYRTSTVKTDATFARHFESLKELMKTHYPNGGYVVPSECQCEDTVSNWIRQIRFSRRQMEQGKEPERRLTDEQISQLDSIGFLWEAPTKSEHTSRLSTHTYDPDATFARHFESLKELMKTHFPNGGYVNPRKCECDKTLMNWIMSIRLARRQMKEGKQPQRRLTDEQISQLDSIGFLWEEPTRSRDTSKPEAQYPTSSQSLMPNLRDTMVGSEDSSKSKDPDATVAKYFETSIPNLSRTMTTSSVETTTASLQSLPSSRTVPRTPIMVEAPSELHAASVPTVPWNPLCGYQQHLSVVPFPPPVCYPPSSILNPYRPLMANPWFSINSSNLHNIAQGTSRLSTRAHSEDATFAYHLESLKKIMKSHYPNGGYVLQSECSCDKILWNWIIHIRNTRRQMKQGKEAERRLTDEQIAQLDSIGFLWEYPSKSWGLDVTFARHFESLKELLKTHYPNGGYVRQSECSCDDTLWKWIMNIRFSRRQMEQGKEPERRLTEEQIVQLDSIGFLWEDPTKSEDTSRLYARTYDPDATFARHFESLKELMKSHYPNGGFVRQSECSCDDTLRNWFRNIRKFRRQMEQGKEPERRLTYEQIAQLDSIGFLWEDPTKSYGPHATFAYHLESLKKIMKSHYPNGGYVLQSECQCDNTLWKWIQKIRHTRRQMKQGMQSTKQLENQQIAQLDSIGFLWEGPTKSEQKSRLSTRTYATFERHFESLKELMKSHYPNGGYVLQSECDCDNTLWSWIIKIRHTRRQMKEGKQPQRRLTDEQISQLDSIGFLWEDPSESRDASKQEAQYPTSSKSLMPNLQNTMVGSEDSSKSNDPDATFAKNFESSIPDLSRTMATSSVATTTAALQSLPSSRTVPQTPIMVEAPSELHPASVPTVPWNPLGGYRQHLSVVPFPPPVFYPPPSILDPYRPPMVNPWFSINSSNLNNIAQGTARLSTRAHSEDAAFTYHLESLKKIMKSHYPNGGYVLQSECQCDDTVSNWIRQIRFSRRQMEQGIQPAKRLSNQQIAQLDSIGFLWEAPTKSEDTSRLSTHTYDPDATFAKYFDSLKELMTTHYPNGGYVLQSECACDSKLWSWIQHIRHTRRQMKQGIQPKQLLSNQHITQLDGIGFLWENPNKSEDKSLQSTRTYSHTTFGKYFESLKELMTTHYPNGGYVLQSECQCDNTLWNWIISIRHTRREMKQGTHSKQGLSNEQITLLDGIGFLWEDPAKSEDEPLLSSRTYGPDAAFARQFESLKEFMKTHYPNGGYVNQRKFKCDKTLLNWIMSIRKVRRQMKQGKEPERRLTGEQIAQLDAIGFLWEDPSKSRDTST